MKTIVPIAAAALALGSAAAVAQTNGGVEGIVRADARPATQGSPKFFTGRATVRPIVDADQMGRTSIGEVVFQPGARSNWHTHPGGQALYVKAGCGLTQREGGPVVRICEGDTAFVPAGVRHWHGATATTAMTQFTTTESVDGKNVNWMEPVTDAQYRAGGGATR